MAKQIRTDALVDERWAKYGKYAEDRKEEVLCKSEMNWEPFLVTGLAWYNIAN